MKRKILLIKTSGCEACQVMDNIIQTAIYRYGKKVEYEVKGFLEVCDEFKRRDIHLTDFPTTVFYENDIIVFMCIGTKPINVMVNYMNVHFD